MCVIKFYYQSVNMPIGCCLLNCAHIHTLYMPIDFENLNEPLIVDELLEYYDYIYYVHYYYRAANRCQFDMRRMKIGISI